ncbi:MAG: hypothetical protein AVDCRST_MAG10-546, partial [uncultured Acidimicrobiales bacterium]
EEVADAARSGCFAGRRLRLGRRRHGRPHDHGGHQLATHQRGRHHGDRRPGHVGRPDDPPVGRHVDHEGRPGGGQGGHRAPGGGRHRPRGEQVPGHRRPGPSDHTGPGDRHQREEVRLPPLAVQRQPGAVPQLPHRVGHVAPAHRLDRHRSRAGDEGGCPGRRRPGEGHRRARPAAGLLLRVAGGVGVARGRPNDRRRGERLQDRHPDHRWRPGVLVQVHRRL